MSGLGSLIHRTRPAAGEPAGVVVLFHGRGTDEGDLAPLLEALDPDERLLGLTPRGPLSLTPGGGHWYAVRRVGYPDRDTFHSSLELTAGWVDSLPAATGVPLERTVLGGFSQGAVMAYALALGRDRTPPAGVLAMSGFIPTVEDFQLDLQDRDGFPVAIAHGVHDPVIGVEWGRRAKERLDTAGLAVTYREGPVAHQIDPQALPDLGAWLRDTVAAAA